MCFLSIELRFMYLSLPTKTFVSSHVLSTKEVENEADSCLDVVWFFESIYLGLYNLWSMVSPFSGMIALATFSVRVAIRSPNATLLNAYSCHSCLLSNLYSSRVFFFLPSSVLVIGTFQIIHDSVLIWSPSKNDMKNVLEGIWSDPDAVI